jgi:glycosyltransferase involved in cell wall biosynthesis
LRAAFFKGNTRHKDVSVVVLAKNEEKYIERCLKSIRNQTIISELIVVDGNSTDRTRAIAAKYADRVVSDKGKGMAHARNLGWKLAKGDIVAYCDADSRPTAEWVENMIKEMHDADAVSGPLSTYDGGLGLVIKFKVWADLVPRLLAAFHFNNLWGANMAFRKSALKREPFKANFLEDFEIGRRLQKIGKVKFTKNVRLSVSSRRFTGGFYRTCVRFYLPAAARIMLLKDYKQSGYYKSGD